MWLTLRTTFSTLPQTLKLRASFRMNGIGWEG
jgi:hypothetical protein